MVNQRVLDPRHAQNRPMAGDAVVLLPSSSLGKAPGEEYGGADLRQRVVHRVSVTSSGTAPFGCAAQSKMRSVSDWPTVRAKGISKRVSQLRPLTPHQRRSTGIWSPIGLSRKNSPVSGFDQKVADSETPCAARPSSKEYQCANFAVQDNSTSPVLATSKTTGASPSVPRLGVGPCPCAMAEAPMSDRQRVAGTSERMRWDTMESSIGGKKFAGRKQGECDGNGKLKTKFVNRWSEI